jgi:hypothetical protein
MTVSQLLFNFVITQRRCRTSKKKKRTQKAGGIRKFLHSKFQGLTFPVFDSPGQVTKYYRCGALSNLDSLRRLPTTRWKKQDMSAL